MQSQAKEFLGFFCTELTFYALYYLMANAILFPEKYISRSIKLKKFHSYISELKIHSQLLE